jgi:hypothetical protein
MDLGRYNSVTAQELGHIFDAIGNMEQSKKIMIDSGVEYYKDWPEAECERAFRCQFVWTIYLNNLETTLKDTPLSKLPKNLIFAGAVNSLIRSQEKMWREPLLKLYQNHQFFHLASKEQTETLQNDLKLLNTNAARNDSAAHEPIVDRCLQEIAAIICNLKNTILEARHGTLLAHITDDVFHQIILKQFEYPHE